MNEHNPAAVWNHAQAQPPRHVAIIMDGNGRWAQRRGLPRSAGHRMGVEAVRRTVRAAIEIGIQYLTIFSFSSENWARPASEIDDLLGDRATDVHLAAVRSRDIECNWKLPGDGNVETYHVPYIHRNSAALGLDEQQTGQWLLPRGHSRMLIRFKFEMPAVLPIPRFAGDTSLAELGVYSFHVFPNLSVVTGPPNSAFLISAFPLSVGRSAYITHFLSPVPRSEETAALIDQSVDANYGVLLEDLAALGPAQKAMASGAADVLRLQYQERRIRYVHEEIDRRIGPERVPEALRVPALLDAYIEET